MIKKFLGVFFFYFAISSCNLDINDKPNIIVFIADDVSWDDIGVYGNDQVVTPNIDNLAKNGLIFNTLLSITILLAVGYLLNKFLLALDSEIIEIIIGSICDAYLQVSVFVAAVLIIVILNMMLMA